MGNPRTFFFSGIKSVSKFWVNLCVPDPVEDTWETSKGKLPLKWPNFIVSFCWCQRAESPSRCPSAATLMNKLFIAACIPNQCHGWKSTDHCAFCVDCCVVRLERFKFSQKSIDPPVFGLKSLQTLGKLSCSFSPGYREVGNHVFQQSHSNTANYTTHRHITTPQALFTWHIPATQLPHNPVVSPQHHNWCACVGYTYYRIQLCPNYNKCVYKLLISNYECCHYTACADNWIY